MIFQLVLFGATFVGLQACLLRNVPNQCPNQTESNALPNPFKYGHPDDCSFYFKCNDGNPELRQCQPPSRFNRVLQTCVDAFSADDICTGENAQRECSKGTTTLIPHPKSCQRYFNCSDTKPRPSQSYFGPFEQECRYPNLFDIVDLQCKDFKVAKCGPDRTAAKDACDYIDNMCGGFQCEPCHSRLPSCIGAEDGLNPYPRREWTPWYIKCDTERLIESSMCDLHSPTNTTGFFSPLKKKCVSLWEVPPETGFGKAPSCEGKEPGLYMIMESANIYYSCHVALEVFYCRHGQVFNTISQKCQ